MCYRLLVTTILLILAITLNAVLGQLVLKYAVTALGGAPALSSLAPFLLSAAKSPLVYVSVVIQGFGYVLWMILLSRTKLGLASALVGAGFYACMALAAWGVYGESLSYLQWLGLCLITLGVACIGLAAA
jgi:multidrug transporter EmrE-like cation transporter